MKIKAKEIDGLSGENMIRFRSGRALEVTNYLM